jgi:hypothetical protein
MYCRFVSGDCAADKSVATGGTSHFACGPHGSINVVAAESAAWNFAAQLTIAANHLLLHLSSRLPIL